MPFCLRFSRNRSEMLRDEFGAAFVQAVHGIARRNRLYGVDEAAFQQVADAVGA